MRHAFQVFEALGAECDRLGVQVVDVHGRQRPCVCVLAARIAHYIECRKKNARCWLTRLSSLRKKQPAASAVCTAARLLTNSTAPQAAQPRLPVTPKAITEGHRRVLEFLAARGDVGGTDEEIATGTGLSPRRTRRDHGGIQNLRNARRWSRPGFGKRVQGAKRWCGGSGQRLGDAAENYLWLT
jgi:hypothetical protein